MEFDSLDKIIKCIGKKLKNNEVDLVCAIAHIAVMSYKKGYNDAAEELKLKAKA
ncbi:MAG: hypothetical protein E6419_02625 [Veillonella sp.]|jgi:hypothetical protein|nr:hypothetical protein [Veillonella sp.]DAJ46105.1 MAG TPA: hypothetical protein [Caudoviricetes sp.]